jgi:flagellar biosynthesis/type III secretory pathway M-ring protein FliF/YscJ
MFVADFTASTEHWLTIVTLLAGMVLGVWRTWRKKIIPYIEEQAKAREEEAKARAWIFEQMSINGRARQAKTSDLGLRDALDQNTLTTQAISRKLDDHLEAHKEGRA